LTEQPTNPFTDPASVPACNVFQVEAHATIVHVCDEDAIQSRHILIYSMVLGALWCIEDGSNLIDPCRCSVSEQRFGQSIDPYFVGPQ